MIDQKRSLTGSAFEKTYLAEIENFANSKAGIRHDDIEAALILKDTLSRLYAGEIQAAVSLDEDSTFSDLRFKG